MKKFFAIIAALVIVGCSQNPHQLKITDQNKDTFMESLKDSKGLTVEEVGLAVSYQIRRSAAEAFKSDSTPPLVGKTVGEIIADERTFQLQQKAKEAEEKRLAEEAKAKQDALVARLRNALTLTVFDKGFIPSNPYASRYDDYITFKTAYENKSGKDIRAFTGTVVFADLFDKPIQQLSLTISDPVAAGSKATWSGTLEFNQFRDGHQRLKDGDLKDMHVSWVPAKILFADGSSLGSD